MLCRPPDTMIIMLWWCPNIFSRIPKLLALSAMCGNLWYWYSWYWYSSILIIFHLFPPPPKGQGGCPVHHCAAALLWVQTQRRLWGSQVLSPGRPHQSGRATERREQPFFPHLPSYWSGWSCFFQAWGKWRGWGNGSITDTASCHLDQHSMEERQRRGSYLSEATLTCLYPSTPSGPSLSSPLFSFCTSLPFFFFGELL